MHLIFVFSLLISFSSFADNNTLECETNFEYDSSEQGGGFYFIVKENDSFSLWHEPYQQQNQETQSRLLTTLKKVEAPSQYFQLYFGQRGDNYYEFVSVGEVGLLIEKWGDWVRSWECR
ncbi:hypothetical protein ACJVC5_03570 [Peredibacter sp. HCB2-198]|uniref:hypothetical protein n=1 Tax=Peredibacter sp. HCB2-198 TaxID=3383025 RepID=UPI0038B65A5F